MRRGGEKAEGCGGRRGTMGFHFSCVPNPTPSLFPEASVAGERPAAFLLQNAQYSSQFIVLDYHQQQKS